MIRKRKVNNVAICFVNSFMNPANEQKMRDILAGAIPDATISLSSDIMPEIFEHERFSIKFQGLDARLTGVEPARVLHDILA